MEAALAADCLSEQQEGQKVDAFRQPGQIDTEKPKAPTELDILRATLAAKKAANEARNQEHADVAELENLKREIAIEEKRAEAYASGLLEEQLLECEWPGMGKCLARTPRDDMYREFAHKSGMLKGDLVNDIAIHERIAGLCMLVPEGKEFLALARKRNPHAPVQFGSAMIKRMQGRLQDEGK